MNLLQNGIVLGYGALSLLVCIKGFRESKDNKNAYGLVPYLYLLGIFTWGDAVIFGLFWLLSSIITIILQDFLLFLLIISVFWLVRSIGETIYWFNQQFSTINRNPPEKLCGYKYFKIDSIWYVYQICWQCVTITSIITTIYLAHLWL